MAVEQLLGSAPDGWEYKSLGAACQGGGGSIQTGPFGSQLHASDYVPVGIPSIMPQNIGDNRIVEDGIARITPKDAQRLSRYLVQAGDIVYSRRGDVERRALVRDHETGWLCGTGCLRVRLGKQGADPRYASYYLGHPDVREWIVRHAHGATMPNLNTSILAACPFLEPPLIEQRAIAHIIGTLDDKIELNRRMSETLEAMARALFKSWFVDFDPVRAKAEGRAPAGMDPATANLFPSELIDSELGLIPEGWRISTVEQLTTLVTKGTTPSKSQGYTTHGIRFVRVNAIDGHGEILSDQLLHIDCETDDALSRSRLCAGDILVSIAGTIGRVAVVEGWLLPANTNQAVALLRPDTSLVEPDLLFRHATSTAIQRHFNERIVHAVQANLSLSTIKAAKIALPDRETQRALSAPISSFHESIRRNRHESQTLARVRDALLPRLLSGELPVDAAERAVEEVA